MKVGEIQHRVNHCVVGSDGKPAMAGKNADKDYYIRLVAGYADAKRT